MSSPITAVLDRIEAAAKVAPRDLAQGRATQEKIIAEVALARAALTAAPVTTKTTGTATMSKPATAAKPATDAEILSTYRSLSGAERQAFFDKHGEQLWRAHAAERAAKSSTTSN